MRDTCTVYKPFLASQPSGGLLMGQGPWKNFKRPLAHPPSLHCRKILLQFFWKFIHFGTATRNIQWQQNFLDKLKNLEKNTFLFCFNSKSLLITKKPNLYPTDSVDFLGNAIWQKVRDTEFRSLGLGWAGLLDIAFIFVASHNSNHKLRKIKTSLQINKNKLF